MPAPALQVALGIARRFATAGVVGVLALDLGSWLPFPGSGPIGLARIFAPHLTLLTILCVPLAFGRGEGVRALRVALVGLAFVAAMAFGDEWLSPAGAIPPDANEPSIEIATWNLEIGSRYASDTVAFLARVSADVIGLQELTPAAAAAIELDPDLLRRYPYRELVASDDVFGLGILSRFPLSEIDFEPGPSRLSALVDTPDGAIQAIVVHPLPGRTVLGPTGLPVGFEPATRDAALRRARDTIDLAIAKAPPVLVIGDINTTPDEPAFDDVRGGLVDAHREVGIGPGWTYRPSRLEWLGIGLIRIDIIFVDDGLRPTATWETCPLIGDHCMASATLAWSKP